MQLSNLRNTQLLDDANQMVHSAIFIPNSRAGNEYSIGVWVYESDIPQNSGPSITKTFLPWYSFNSSTKQLLIDSVSNEN